MTSDLLELLVRLALASSGAMLFVLLLRRPLRHFAGADAAYLGWLIVPFALLAAALPSMQVAPTMVKVLAFKPTLDASALVASAAPAGAPWFDWLLLAWACGAVATVAMLVRCQSAFVRSLGALVERDGIFFAENALNGPALLGLWRPVIVVPLDFNARYSDDEQALIIAHEQQHAARRDPCANAALALLQCVFWFNPLVHIAASRFRFDQELACDAAVMARHGGKRQAYAAAMLKTQSVGAPALATCHWQSSHPLKERIMHLKQTLNSAPRRRAGRMIVALLACASVLTTVAVRADTAADKGKSYAIAIQFAEGADNATPPLPIKVGEEFKFNWDQSPVHWSGTFTLTAAKPGSVNLKMKIVEKNGAVSTPTMLLKLGESGSVKLGGENGRPEFSIGATVSEAEVAVSGS